MVSGEEAAPQVGLAGLGPGEGQPVARVARGGWGEGEGPRPAPQAPAKLSPGQAGLVRKGQGQQGVEPGLEGRGGGVPRGPTET